MKKELRDSVLKRDNYKCRYCGAFDLPFQIDHVYPLSRGGETIIENLVTSCYTCNQKKHNRVGIWPLPVGHFDNFLAKIMRLLLPEKDMVFYSSGVSLPSPAETIRLEIINNIDGTSEELTLPVNREDFIAVCRFLASGGSFSHATLAGAGKLLSRSKYESLTNYLLEHEYIAWRNDQCHNQGLMVTSKGFELFAAEA